MRKYFFLFMICFLRYANSYFDAETSKNGIDILDEDEYRYSKGGNKYQIHVQDISNQNRKTYHV